MPAACCSLAAASSFLPLLSKRTCTRPPQADCLPWREWQFGSKAAQAAELANWLWCAAVTGGAAAGGGGAPTAPCLTCSTTALGAWRMPNSHRDATRRSRVCPATGSAAAMPPPTPKTQVAAHHPRQRRRRHRQHAHVEVTRRWQTPHAQQHAAQQHAAAARRAARRRQAARVQAVRPRPGGAGRRVRPAGPHSCADGGWGGCGAGAPHPAACAGRVISLQARGLGTLRSPRITFSSRSLSGFDFVLTPAGSLLGSPHSGAPPSSGRAAHGRKCARTPTYIQSHALVGAPPLRPF